MAVVRDDADGYCRTTRGSVGDGRGAAGAGRRRDGGGAVGLESRSVGHRLGEWQVGDALEFAADVEATQNAIRDLLGRLSPAGFLDGIGALLSGDALDELKEIPEDIRTVLDNLKRQADSRQQSMQDVMQLIDGAVVSLEQKARKEFTHYLGEDVGNAAATVFDFQLNMREGILKGGIGALEDIQQLNPLRFAYDFEGAKDTWGGMLETNFHASIVGQIIDPERAAQTQKEMLQGAVHAEDWTTERPGLGLGQNLFDVGSAMVGGAGAARAGTRAAGEAADAAGPGVRAAGVVDDAVTETSAIAGRAGSIADNLDDIGDTIPPGATGVPSGPGVPSSLAEPPSAPRVPEVSSAGLSEPLAGDRTPAAPHAPAAGEGARTHAGATPSDAVRSSPVPIAAASEARLPSADSPTVTHESASAPAIPSGNDTPTPVMARNAPEPATVGAHSPLSANVSHAAQAAQATTHGPSSTAPEASPYGHLDSGAGGSHPSESPPTDAQDGSRAWDSANDTSGPDDSSNLPDSGDDSADGPPNDTNNSPSSPSYAGPYPLPEASKLTPPPDGAFFWSGRNAEGVGIGPESAGGSGAADLYAASHNGTTLEGLIEGNGITPPKWSFDDSPSQEWWSEVSRIYASNAEGEVRAVVGSNLRPGNIWETVELPRLMENPNVTRIIIIDPDTGTETIIFERPKE